MIVTLAGHVDHGKSALVHALTGTKTDRLAEEKRRGLTLDLGFAYTTSDKVRLGFVDVPGHHRFIHNMVAGVANQQFALLVVAADDGVMPQTREHLDILQTLALNRGCVALTKTDLVDDDRVTEVIEEIETLSAGSFLEAAPIFPCSAIDAGSLGELRSHLHAAATHNQIQNHNQDHNQDHNQEESTPFRLAVDRSFTLTGAGCVVTGTVHSGSVAVGDNLVMGLDATPVRVRGLRVQNEEATRASTGDRAAINIAGIDHQAVNRGDWLLADIAHNPCSHPVIDLKLLAGAQLKNWGRVHVHAATTHRLGRVALYPDDSSAEVLAELVLDEPMQAKHGDRIVLRDYARQSTLGGGAVVFAGSEPTRRRQPEHIAKLHSYLHSDPAQSLKQLLDRGPADLSDWRRTYLLGDETAAALVNAADAQTLPHQKQLSTTRAAFERCLRAVVDTVTAHKQTPEDMGLTLKQLSKSLGEPMSMVRAAATELTQKQVLQNLRGRYQLPQVANQLSDSLTALLEKCTPLIDAPHPASLGDLSKKLNLPLATLTKALNQISKARALVRIGDKRYALPKQVQAWADMTEGLSAVAPFSVKEFRDRCGLGRNMSIDVLEFMDSKGYTRRNGDTRTVVGDRSTLR